MISLQDNHIHSQSWLRLGLQGPVMLAIFLGKVGYLNETTDLVAVSKFNNNKITVYVIPGTQNVQAELRLYVELPFSLTQAVRRVC
ncbi:MAG: hypothetical protein U0930_11180 [Pirellulales bacterium]